jgi:hypothetical protein
MRVEGILSPVVGNQLATLAAPAKSKLEAISAATRSGLAAAAKTAFRTIRV